ncbi:MAG: hypothetical protein DLM53_08545 [Candidatus Eremiobacter antarcticus]|nr:(2Fe-2S)-binding protein [Candidatus Eremiobacteraeota bacterium]MBC5809123.1 (2Fe-2S)-binding protein [Candidatus Eremiobacteraeota bacterium]PZR61623.1 MAG: hypothetical protein DLM53_08545 [Candidatus Eremiobacter sp. RRmetagenome_bin22]
MMQPVNLMVNGTPYELLVHPSRSLLQVLRDDLHLTGTKEGCGTGYCGACTVLVEDAAVNACLYFAVDADHRHVRTIEAMRAPDGSPQALPAAFIECSGLQCGYCTPGMIMSAAALLASDPSPAEDDVRSALSGNICRCTGYQSIVASVMLAAARMAQHERQTQPEPSPRSRSRA